jgi:hypothetical protein
MEEFGCNEPEVFSELVDTLLLHKEELLPKLGNFKGHLCEAVHHDRLKEMASLEKVVKHPNGAQKAPDHKFESDSSLCWLEDKNCLSVPTKRAAKEGCVSLRNYKHSYRNVENSGTADLYYERPDETDQKHILAVCLYPQTKRFEWRYCFYRDLPPHPKHPDRVASALKIPICPPKDSPWATNLESLLKEDDGARIV